MRSIPSSRWVLLAAMAVLVANAAGCALTGVSRSDEIRLGQQVAAEIEQQNRTYEDAALTRLGQQLAAASAAPDYPYRFRVIQDDEINAFALPGGPVYVTSGMIEFTRGNPEQLAAVVAHEIAHVAERHSVEQIQRQQWLGLGIGVLTRGSLQDIALLAANLEELGYNRNQEREADTLGAVYLLRVGMDPMAAVRLFERMGAQGGGGGIAFLRTHPTSEERVTRLRDQIASGEIRRLAQEGR
jgi:predicted Zn-dependent protease